MLMDETNYIQHWNYFCLLAKQLDQTKDFVYHGAINYDGENIELIHGNVYSDIFKQIIFSACAEFEILSRAVCNYHGVSARNVVGFSSMLLKLYPKIIDTEIYTIFWRGFPLKNWCIDLTKADHKVSGIEWWDAYSEMKHDETNSYIKATLNNAIMSLGSLYIIHLYLMFEEFGDLGLLKTYPTVYFNCKYEPAYVYAAEGKLPDFGNKSTVEVYKEQFESLKEK